MTIEHIWPIIKEYSPVRPITLQVGEINDYDFSESASQIYRILTMLDLANLIKKNPFRSARGVKAVIFTLINDIDLGSDELQISEKRHIRVEFRDELLSVEVFVGV